MTADRTVTALLRSLGEPTAKPHEATHEGLVIVTVVLRCGCVMQGRSSKRDVALTHLADVLRDRLLSMGVATC